MEKVKKFFDFEVQNKLFDIVDQYGLRPWEAVRYEVMMSVLYKPIIHFSEFKTPFLLFRLLYLLEKLMRFSIYLFTHNNKENLFVLCSRDKKDGILYDKILDRLYALVDKNTSFTIETKETYHQQNYKYGKSVAPDISHYLAKISTSWYDYGDIIKMVKQEFPESSITITKMNKCYREFVTEYKFYRHILRRCHIKRIFLVQNGIRKGLFAAANEMGIKMIELQHGQISVNHPAYSYPSEALIPSSKVYHPDYLLTFGPFWSKNRHYPGVEDLVIGNESYAEDIGKSNTNTNTNKKLLVISNNIEGKLLAKRIDEVLAYDPTFFFFFKLHPDQYNEYEYYNNYFRSTDRVIVISNQQSINQLLSQCEGVFLNDSTVELEALRMGRKVFVLTEQYFECMDFVLGEEGVYACKDINEFFAKYKQSQNVTLQPRDDFFCKFDEKVAKKMLRI